MAKRWQLTTEPTTAYVALGYNIVWETIRTHWFDSVTLSGILTLRAWPR